MLRKFNEYHSVKWLMNNDDNFNMMIMDDYDYISLWKEFASENDEYNVYEFYDMDDFIKMINKKSTIIKELLKYDFNLNTDDFYVVIKKQEKTISSNNLENSLKELEPLNYKTILMEFKKFVYEKYNEKK